ncbi:GSCOCG00011732001-RA-CDS, partial [Cotesia congregata]
SENYSCKYGTEVQSVHFGASRTQCTLHTGMIYSQNFSQGFATLSQSLRHDPAAITAHLKQILNYYLLQLPNIKKIHFMSDGPTTQYRNRKMFYIITQYFPLCYPQIQFISYNFSDAGHGKSAADGIGGFLKRSADDQVKFGKDISNFDKLITVLRGSTNKIYIDVVTSPQIEIIDTLLPEKFRPFIGTMNMHQYTWSRENSGLILFNSLMCLDCQPGTMCEHFSMGEINYNDNRLKLASPKEKKTLKRSQKVSVVADE